MFVSVQSYQKKIQKNHWVTNDFHFILTACDHNNSQAHVMNIKLIILNRFSPHNNFSPQTNVYIIVCVCVLYICHFYKPLARVPHIHLIVPSFNCDSSATLKFNVELPLLRVSSRRAYNSKRTLTHLIVFVCANEQIIELFIAICGQYI